MSLSPQCLTALKRAFPPRKIERRLKQSGACAKDQGAKALAGRKKGTPKTGGRDWKPGQSGNPAGSKPLGLDAHERRLLKVLTAKEFAEMASTLLYATDAEINAILEDALSPKFKRIIAKALNRAEDEGNFTALNQVLDRVVGTVMQSPPPKDDDQSRNAAAILADFRKLLDDPANGREISNQTSSAVKNQR